jgi:hypothetical protein
LCEFKHADTHVSTQVLKVCDANKTNERQLEYDERNPFVVCM